MGGQAPGAAGCMINKNNALKLLREIAEIAISRIEKEAARGKYLHLHHSTIFSHYSRIFKQSLSSYCDELIFLSKIDHNEANEIRSIIDQAKELIALRKYININHPNYPDIPFPHITPTKHGDHIPCTSGIYILWNKGAPTYVGQSQNLSVRCTLAHPKVLPTDKISFVELELEELDYAECFYISLLRPNRNFGMKARHQSNRSTSSPTSGE